MRFNEGGYKDPNGLVPRSNFDSLIYAFITVFHTITSDKWYVPWFDSVKGGNSYLAYFYFIFLLIVGKIVFLNSFIALMLANFEEAISEINKL